jgi:hypothetical protein
MEGMERRTVMGSLRRLPRSVRLGVAVVVAGIAGWIWAGVARQHPEPVMPLVTPGATVPPGASTTTGMSTVGIVGIRRGTGRALIVNVAACGSVRNAVDVGEDATRVVLYARTTGGGDGFCSDGVTVSLVREFDGRTVVDGHSSRPVAVDPQ